MTIRPAPGLLFRRFSVALPFFGFAVLLMLVNDPNGHLRCQYEWLQFLSMEMLLLLPLITTVLLCISIGRDNLKRTRSVPKLVAVWVLLIVAIPCSGFAAIFTYCNLRMLSPDGMNQHVTTIRLGSRDVEVYRYRDLVCGGGPILYRYQEERSVLPGLKQVKELTREEAEGGYNKLSAKEDEWTKEYETVRSEMPQN